MKRYYEKHKCGHCGCYYMAFGPASRHCPDCLNEHEHKCKKCGEVFKPKSLDSEYCGKHRSFQSPAYLAKYSKRAGATKEERKTARMQRKNEGRRVNKVVVPSPPAPKPEVKKERRMLNPVAQMVFRPAKEPGIKKEMEKPVDKFFLRTGPKTVYGFTTQERLDSFKKRNDIA